MLGNPLPWIALLAVVVVVLAYKGYLKPPSLGGARPTPGTGHSLPDLTSQELGMLFAQAKRKEAEEELMAEFIKQAGDGLKSAFTAPFAPPAPAGQAPPAGGPPTP